MVLDEKQKSGWGWAQNSLVTINRGTGEVRYNPDFQPVCLVSRFVWPGAARISAASHNGGPVSAFRGSDGAMVILAQNRTAEAVVLEIQVDGRKAKVALPANADSVVLAP